MAILRIKDDAGNIVEIPAIKGKSAYSYAQDGGYTGTEEEFAAKLSEEWASADDLNDLEATIKDQQEQINNKLDDGDITTEETDNGYNVTLGSKTIVLYHGQNGTVQLEPLFAESVEWLEENGDTSKVYILPNSLIYAYQWTEGEQASYTNWLPLSTDSDGTTIYNEVGYKDGYRLNSSGVEKAVSGMMVSGYMPITYGDIIRIQGVVDTTTSYTQEVCFYDSSYTFLGYTGKAKITDTLVGWTYDADADTTTIDTTGITQASSITNCAFFRIAFGDLSSAIVTVNEEISGSAGTESGYRWTSTGHSFVLPSNYEERIIALEKKSNNGSESSVQNYLNERNTYIAPVPSGYCESYVEYADTGKTVLNVYDLETMIGMFSTLASENSDYITETLLGQDASGTYNIYKYELDFNSAISDGYSSVMSADKPVFIITSGLHGIEHDAVHEVYHFMKDLCENYMESEYLEYLRNNVKFVIVPISNPWGYTNQSYYNSNEVDLNKNFGDGSGYQNNGTDYTGESAYSEAETVLLKGVFDEYSNAIYHLECHGKATPDSSWGSVIWFSNMAYLESDLIEICSNTVINQISRRLYKIGYETEKAICGYITYYTLNGRPKDYTATEYGMLSCTMEATGRLEVAGHTTYMADEQRINTEALENFILRVLDSLNSRVEI